MSPTPTPDKLASEIEESRRQIEKLQDRVRKLVSRRDKRTELVKASATLNNTELLSKTNVARTEAAKTPTPRTQVEFVSEKELTFDEGMTALRRIRMSEVRLIDFHHGNVVFLMANDQTVTVKLDERGPKPLLDLLSANDAATRPAPALQAPVQPRA